jgi:hypothetical protein
MRYYILVGDEDTWKTALSNNIWGFSRNTKGSWNTCSPGDLLAFYVTSPTKKIIGFGRVGKKYEDNNITWKDERFLKRSIWMYRIEIEKIHVINDWSRGLEVDSTIMLNVGRKVIDSNTFRSLLRRADRSWETRLASTHPILSQENLR